MRFELEYLDDTIWLEWGSFDMRWCVLEGFVVVVDGESDDRLGGFRIENKPSFNSNARFASSSIDAVIYYR